METKRSYKVFVSAHKALRHNGKWSQSKKITCKKLIL